MSDNQEFDFNDAKVISLSQILEIDNTLYNLPELKLDVMFKRNDINDNWKMI